MNFLLRTFLLFALAASCFFGLASFRAFVSSWLWPSPSPSERLKMMPDPADYEDYDEMLRKVMEEYGEYGEDYDDYYDYPHMGDL